MTVEQFIALITSGGGYVVMAMWLYSERAERVRLQRMLEGFLPVMRGTQRAMENVSRVVGGDDVGAQ